MGNYSKVGGLVKQPTFLLFQYWRKLLSTIRWMLSFCLIPHFKKKDNLQYYILFLFMYYSYLRRAILSSFDVLLRKCVTTSLCFENILSTPASDATNEKHLKLKSARTLHSSFVLRKVHILTGFSRMRGVMQRLSVESMTHFKKHPMALLTSSLVWVRMSCSSSALVNIEVGSPCFITPESLSSMFSVVISLSSSVLCCRVLFGEQRFKKVGGGPPFSYRWYNPLSDQSFLLKHQETPSKTSPHRRHRRPP